MLLQMLKRIDCPQFPPVVTRLLPACCLLLLFSAPVFADWYQVEVVLFTYTEPDAGGELWYENPGLPARGQTTGLLMEVPDPGPGATSVPAQEEERVPYLALPKWDYRLAGVRRVLAQSEDYRPLLHVAWQQPGLGLSDVRAVHLDNTRLEKRRTAPAQAEPGEARDTSGYTPPVKIFDGTVRLYGSRFLHLDVDFAYFPDVLERPGPGERAAGYGRLSANYVRLTESRRIRLDALNYFDHPLFGLIVQVSRMEIAEPESAVPGQ